MGQSKYPRRYNGDSPEHEMGGEETQGVVGREVDHEVADVETTGARFRRRRRLKCKREVHMQRSR